MTTAYQGLVQERADLVAEAEALFESVEAAGGEMTDKDKERDDEIEERIKILAGEIGRHNRHRERMREVDAIDTVHVSIAAAGADS